MRNRAWRGAGVLMIAAGAGAAVPAADGSMIATLAGLALALSGIAFAVQGKRIPLALRVERSRHRALPALLHARRARR